MRLLVVGDIHLTAASLDDFRELGTLILSVVAENKVDAVLFLGDLHDSHDTVSVKVMSAYREFFGILSKETKVFALRGNHDQSDPTKEFPHALGAYNDLIMVIERPTAIGDGVGAIPYIYDPEDFIRQENELYDRYRMKFTYCHATVLGAAYDNGFFAKDAIDLSKIKTPKLGSGHIHTAQRVGDRVTYFGASRWMTAADSGKEKAIWIVEHADDGTVVSTKAIKTDTFCRRIYCFEDRPDAPMKLELTGKKRELADVRVKVFGPPDRVIERAKQIRAEWPRARVQEIPDQLRQVTVRESDGKEVAWGKFAGIFVPSRGTPVARVKEVVAEVVPWAA